MVYNDLVRACNGFDAQYLFFPRRCMCWGRMGKLLPKQVSVPDLVVLPVLKSDQQYGQGRLFEDLRPPETTLGSSPKHR